MVGRKREGWCEISRRVVRAGGSSSIFSSALAALRCSFRRPCHRRSPRDGHHRRRRGRRIGFSLRMSSTTIWSRRLCRCFRPMAAKRVIAGSPGSPSGHKARRAAPGDRHVDVQAFGRGRGAEQTVLSRMSGWVASRNLAMRQASVALPTPRGPVSIQRDAGGLLFKRVEKRAFGAASCPIEVFRVARMRGAGRLVWGGDIVAHLRAEPLPALRCTPVASPTTSSGRLIAGRSRESAQAYSRSTVPGTRRASFCCRSQARNPRNGLRCRIAPSPERGQGRFLGPCRLGKLDPVLCARSSDRATAVNCGSQIAARKSLIHAGAVGEPVCISPPFLPAASAGSNSAFQMVPPRGGKQ